MRRIGRLRGGDGLLALAAAVIGGAGDGAERVVAAGGGCSRALHAQGARVESSTGGDARTCTWRC